MKSESSMCSYCSKKTRFKGDLSDPPPFCPSANYADLLHQAKETLQTSENQRMAQDVARTWKEYGKLTRVEETIEYACLQGHQKIRLAFCVGLSEEARLFTNVLLNAGFQVASVCCMCGALSSDDVSLPERDKIVAGFRQPMCNPIGQAAVLDEEGCDCIPK